MNKEFIPYEQALELKELGFNEQCFAAQKDNIIDYGSEMHSFIYNMDCGDIWVALPLYQQAFRWFREKHELRISNYRCSIKKEGGIVIGDGFRIFKYGKDTISTIEKETYEEAELACLKKLIEIVKKNI
jgi:hypothetical protein